MARREGGGSGSGAAGAHKTAHPMAWALMLLRIFIGAKFLESGVSQWNWIGTDHLHMILQKWTTSEAPAAYVTYIPFLTKWVMPHAPAATYLLVLGELIVGSMLVLGFATRLASLPALFLSSNFLLATWNIGFEWQSVNEAFLAIEAVLLLTGAGRFGGIDTPLARKHPKWPIW